MKTGLAVSRAAAVGGHAAFASGYIRLARASVREYLVSDSPCLTHYSLNDQESYDIPASRCLVYLLRFEADEWTTDDCESVEGLTYAVRETLNEGNTHIDLQLNSRNALHGGSARGYEKIVEMLLHHGANVNTPGKWDGANALGIACDKSCDGIAIWLLAKGADTYAECRWRENALAITCVAG